MRSCQPVGQKHCPPNLSRSPEIDSTESMDVTLPNPRCPWAAGLSQERKVELAKLGQKGRGRTPPCGTCNELASCLAVRTIPAGGGAGPAADPSAREAAGPAPNQIICKNCQVSA